MTDLASQDLLHKLSLAGMHQAYNYILFDLHQNGFKMQDNVYCAKNNSTVHNGLDGMYRQFTWTEDSKYILYLQDVGGDENFHLYLQPLDGSPAKDLTPYEGSRAQNLVTDKHFPGEVSCSISAGLHPPFTARQDNFRCCPVPLA